MSGGLEYVAATDQTTALRALARPGAVPLGGGTDLLVSMQEGLSSPATLVDLRRMAGGTSIEWQPDGSLRVGAAVRLAQIAGDATVRARLAAFAESCEAVGSPALREMGTLGGNLCQRPRCWYYRSGVACLKSGGDGCPAIEGENQHHAILGGGPCHAVHPSDPAVALVALEASVLVAATGGEREVPVESFFVSPTVRLDAETVLGPGEFVAGVSIPARSSGGRQRYVKLMQRGGVDFALASIAAVRRADGAVRLALGGVAPVPWRVSPSVEEDIASAALSADDVDTLSDRALYDAVPLSRNGYKVTLARTLLRDAIAYLAAT